MSAQSTRVRTQLDTQRLRTKGRRHAEPGARASNSRFGAFARVAIGVMLILSPWAAYLLDLLHGIADALMVLSAVVIGFLLVASGALHARHAAGNTGSATGRHRALHGVAVAGVAILVLLLTARALGA